MKAIWTKYLGPTNTRGSRIKASAEGVPSIYVPGDGASVEDVHDFAAVALCRKMGWPGDLIRGGRPDGAGYVYVFAANSTHSPEYVHNPTPSYAEQEASRVARQGHAGTARERR